MKIKILYFLLITIKTSIKIFLIVILFSNQSYSSDDYCDFKKNNYLKELNNKKNIIQINIKTNNLRKWTKNNLEILKSNEDIINQKLKKNYKSTIEIKYNFGTCKYPSKIRQTGDFKDHIKFSKGKIYQSLKIKLLEGNILGNVRFKLLIPKTRGDDEIIVSKLLKSLDILSPEIFLIEVNNNGYQDVMLFHQEADKEFMEQNYRIESAIYEGDESLIWNFQDIASSNYNYLEKFSLARMVNSKWTEKNTNTKIISSKAYSTIQKIYLNKINKNNEYYFDINLLSNNKKDFIEKWIFFELLMLSSNCSHGLNGINRKFYWDSLHEAFLPIFYDGNCKIDYKYNSRLIKSDFLNSADKQYYKKIFKNKNLNELKNKIARLDINFIFENSIENNKLDKTKIKDKIGVILENLDKLEKYLSKNNGNKIEEVLDYNFEITKLENVFDKKSINYFFLDLNSKDITSTNEINFYLCKKNDCHYQEFEIGKLFSTDLNKKENKYIFKDFKNQKNNLIEEQIIINNNEIKIKRSKGIKIKTDKDNLYIVQKNEKDRIVFFNSNLKNLNIYYSGIEKKKQNKERFNDNGITGCLSFVNINFLNNINISYDKSNCEDSINIRNSKGKIHKIEIKNSMSDAIDIDFSEIIINDIVISKANNDCIDFSHGKYKIRNIYTNYCKDKAVSLGERSTLDIKSAKIYNSNMGLVSKDSSILNIKEFKLHNVDFCASAYNKKQEFDGGIIFLDKNSCEASKLYNDKLSKIIFQK
ncbi:hypothetical protein OAM93_00810 [Candidatus Pelagibacter sp.]|nr:hypothetical protein [Candidatus Pelagibacter sp.]